MTLNLKGKKMKQKKVKHSPDELDKFVGARIKTIRLANKVSQSELGDFLGVSFQQVGQYESGGSKISAGKLCKTARFLGVPVQSLLPDEYTDTKQLDIFQNEITKTLLEIGDDIQTIIKKIGAKK